MTRNNQEVRLQLSDAKRQYEAIIRDECIHNDAYRVEFEALQAKLAKPQVAAAPVVPVVSVANALSEIITTENREALNAFLVTDDNLPACMIMLMNKALEPNEHLIVAAALLEKCMAQPLFFNNFDRYAQRIINCIHQKKQWHLMELFFQNEQFLSNDVDGSRQAFLLALAANADNLGLLCLLCKYQVSGVYRIASAWALEKCSANFEVLKDNMQYYQKSGFNDGEIEAGKWLGLLDAFKARLLTFSPEQFRDLTYHFSNFHAYIQQLLQYLNEQRPGTENDGCVTVLYKVVFNAYQCVFIQDHSPDVSSDEWVYPGIKEQVQDALKLLHEGKQGCFCFFARRNEFEKNVNQWLRISPDQFAGSHQTKVQKA